MTTALTPEQENELAARFRSVADTIVVGRQTSFDMEAYWTKVRRLKSSAGGALVLFGGVQAIRSMSAADLVDVTYTMR